MRVSVCLGHLVCAAVLALVSLTGPLHSRAAQAGTLDEVRKRGHVACGVSEGTPGLSVADDGKIQGIYELASPADSVKVEILAASGAVIDTIDLSAQTSGRHEFDWAAKPGGTGGETFRITAKTGTASVTTTTLTRDRVDAVATGGDTLTLELRHFGSVPFEQIKTLN